MRYLFILLLFILGCTTIQYYYPPEAFVVNGYILNSAVDQNGNVYYRMETVK